MTRLDAFAIVGVSTRYTVPLVLALCKSHCKDRSHFMFIATLSGEKYICTSQMKKLWVGTNMFSTQRTYK